MITASTGAMQASLDPVLTMRTGVIGIPFGARGLEAVRQGLPVRGTVDATRNRADYGPVPQEFAHPEPAVIDVAPGTTMRARDAALNALQGFADAAYDLAQNGGDMLLGDERILSSATCPSAGSLPGALCQAALLLRRGEPVIAKAYGVTVSFPPLPSYYREGAHAGLGDWDDDDLGRVRASFARRGHGGGGGGRPSAHRGAVSARGRHAGGGTGKHGGRGRGRAPVRHVPPKPGTPTQPTTFLRRLPSGALVAVSSTTGCPPGQTVTARDATGKVTCSGGGGVPAAYQQPPAAGGAPPAYQQTPAAAAQAQAAVAASPQATAAMAGAQRIQDEIAYMQKFLATCQDPACVAQVTAGIEARRQAKVQMMAQAQAAMPPGSPLVSTAPDFLAATGIPQSAVGRVTTPGKMCPPGFTYDGSGCAPNPGNLLPRMPALDAPPPGAMVPPGVSMNCPPGFSLGPDGVTCAQVTGGPSGGGAPSYAPTPSGYAPMPPSSYAPAPSGYAPMPAPFSYGGGGGGAPGGGAPGGGAPQLAPGCPPGMVPTPDGTMCLPAPAQAAPPPPSYGGGGGGGAPSGGGGGGSAFLPEPSMFSEPVSDEEIVDDDTGADEEQVMGVFGGGGSHYGFGF